MKNNTNNKGQTLVMLLVLTAIAITVTLAAVSLVVTNSTAASKFELGTFVSQTAEGGAETALLKLLRNPNYTGETFTIDLTAVTISVTGSTTKTILSQATMGTITKKVQIVVNYPLTGSMTVSSWGDTF
jgi:hypothetical protein